MQSYYSFGIFFPSNVSNKINGILAELQCFLQLLLCVLKSTDFTAVCMESGSVFLNLTPSQLQALLMWTVKVISRFM